MPGDNLASAGGPVDDGGPGGDAATLNLLSAAGKAWLEANYVAAGLPIRVLADMSGRTKHAVREALIFHGVRPRSKAAAQRLAMATGRHKRKPHRDRQTRERIAEGVAAHWWQMTKAELEQRSVTAAEQWAAMTEDERAAMRRLSAQANARAAAYGSRLEIFLRDGLRAAGYTVHHRSDQAEPAAGGDTVWGPVADLYLPGPHVAVDVYGALNVWPFDASAWHAVRAEKAIAEGMLVVHVRHDKSLSDHTHRLLLNRLLAIIKTNDDRRQVITLEVESGTGRAQPE